MSQGEKCETMSEGEKLKSCVLLAFVQLHHVVKQLKQPQLVKFSVWEGGCLANKKEGEALYQLSSSVKPIVLEGG